MHKKASEDQFMAFVSSSLELSHYSLSLSLTLGNLEFFLEHSSLEQGKGIKDQGKESEIK